MDRARNRRGTEYVGKIRQALQDKQLVIIVGAGISLSATHPSPPRITWTGLIRDGLDYLQDKGFVAANDQELNHYQGVLQQDNANIRTVLRACHYLKGELDHYKQFPTWLESVFGSLHHEVTHPEVFEALREFHRRGARLMTTNYDELLEHYCNLQRVRRSIPEDVRKYEQGTLNGVFHIHGSFQDPKEVVLDPIGYYQVKTSEDTQNLLMTYLGHNTILFLGCGSGLEDPNFNALLEWASSREESIPNHHYLLVRDGDTLSYNPLITVKYGRNYEDLVPYLNALLDNPAHALAGPGVSAAGISDAAVDIDIPCLRAWRLTDPREDKDRILNSKDPLLEGSCTWIFHDQAFTEWWGNDESRILWIHGEPGKGKTMMMMALIEEISQRLQTTPGSGIMSYFFCQNTFQELNTTVAIIRGLIYFLATHNPPLIRHLRKKLDEAGDHLFEEFNALYGLWNTLLEVAKDLKFPRVYLLIDALDECDNKSINDFLSLLSQERSASAGKIKWVVTSRNERIIREILQQSHLGPNTSLELNSSHVSKAVKSFINFKVNVLAARKGYKDELHKSVRQYLNKHADGTFLWVALVCKELEKVELWKTQTVLKRFPGGLNPLYQRMMEQIKDDGDTEDIELRKTLLFTVTLACRPLHLDEIGVISNLPVDFCNDTQALQDLATSCGSFLTVREQIVTFVHQSARDYFTIGAGSKEFPLEQMHYQLTHRLLRFMSKTLQRDICALQKPGTILSEVGSGLVGCCVPLYVQYACCYWVHHLQMSDSKLCDNDEFHQFLREHLLYWLEVLTLMGKTSEGVLAITSLESHIPANKSPSLYAFVHDAKRFALYNRAMIEYAPLQIYCSALVFAPERSIIRQQFKEQIPKWICKTPIVESNWRSVLQALEGHSNWVTAVAFSPDGKMVASVSADKTVRLWDSATGSALQTLEGHSDWVTAVAFSPDGKMVASASDDETVRLWDSATGSALQTLKGHSNWVSAVAFSPDGRMVASTSDDKTVRLWDSATGSALQTLEGHSDLVSAVAFSPDGKMVASASHDETVRLWDSATGSALQTLEGHSNWVRAVAFSPDGKMVASASADNTVRLWDSATRAALQTLDSHSDWVRAVVFSPNGKMVASASADKTVRLWDSATGAALQTLKGHSNRVTAVAFSPDGKMMASASDDKTVRLWDSATGSALQTLEGHSDWVSAVVFSPDGKMVASASGEKTVRLWDSATGAALQTLEGHSNWVTAVAFSPDGKMVASASADKTVRLWDSATGAALQTLKGHSNWVSAVAFSPNGKMVASASGDETFRL